MSTPSFDTGTPNVARMYDYWLGGTDNFEADRQAAAAVRRIRPNVAEQALDNKRFQTRAVTYVAGHGVRQFLDVGSGLPTSPAQAPGAGPQWLATHEAARRVMPDAMVAYVDHDSIAVQHSRVLLGDGHDAVVAVEADMRDPKAILADDEIRAAGFDLDAPACVVLACVLHFVDAGTARDITSTFARMLAPGSYLVISVGFGRGREGTSFASTYNAQNGPRIYAHSWEEITGLFDGLDLVPPGIAETSDWLPGQPETALGDRESMIVAGVASRPLRAAEPPCYELTSVPGARRPVPGRPNHGDAPSSWSEPLRCSIVVVSGRGGRRRDAIRCITSTTRPATRILNSEVKRARTRLVNGGAEAVSEVSRWRQVRRRGAGRWWRRRGPGR